MSEDHTNNPFAVWQQFWQNATPQAAALMPPLTLADTEKKINELKNVEVWLNFNLQAVRTQISLLEQQKNFFDHRHTARETDAENR